LEGTGEDEVAFKGLAQLPDPLLGDLHVIQVDFVADEDLRWVNRLLPSFFGPWSCRSLIQSLSASKELGLVTSKTSMTPLASRKYSGAMALNFSCPAVSQIWVIFPYLQLIILIVPLKLFAEEHRSDGRLGELVDIICHILAQDRGLSHTTVSQEHYFQ